MKNWSGKLLFNININKKSLGRDIGKPYCRISIHHTKIDKGTIFGYAGKCYSPLITEIVDANPNEVDMENVFQHDGAPLEISHL